MSQLPIKNYKCDELLLKSETVTRIINDYDKWRKPKNIVSKYSELAVSTFVSILFNLLATLTAWSSMQTLWQIVAVCLLAALGAYAVFCVFKWVDAAKEVKGVKARQLDEMLLEGAKENMRHTGIVRIAYKDKDRLIYLTGPDFFLPHGNLRIDNGIDEQEEVIAQCLQEFEIREKDIIRVRPVDGKMYHSIKPIRGTVQMNAYVFYDVFIKEQEKARITQQNHKRKWVSIEEMRKNPKAVLTNKDVIDLLDSFTPPDECFENLLGNYKIIWNITSKCPYNCAICATHDEGRQELDANGKLKVLNSICSAKHKIQSVDFAGGDPLYFGESATIIQSAIEQLGGDKVSITTTGEGILASATDDFLGVVKHCELTVDASHANLSDALTGEGNAESFLSRQENAYSNNNIDNIHLISEHAEYLTINIPIINDDLDDTEIANLLQKILWIKDHAVSVTLDVSLLRLMPVGKMKEALKKDQYLKYNPISVIQKIRTKMEENAIPCKLHCSLRVLPNLDKTMPQEHCSMLENKLGIDCAGNVFACAWGGYIPSNDPPTQNPFYLGNLTKVPLIKIINGASRTQPYMSINAEIENRNLRHFCSVVSYYATKELFKNSDPLAQTTK